MTLDEYSIKPGRTSSKAGDVTFTAHNIGSVAHQLLVLKTERRPDKLPVRKGVVLVDAKGIELAGELEIVAEGDSETLSLTMLPGNYVLICNIASHYTNGMHSPFHVDRA